MLRHRPDVIGLQLDHEGWLDIDQLIKNANKHGHLMTLEILHEVVATNDKRRFALSEDGLRIRANQGHSVLGVELNLQPVIPPAILFHGTVSCFTESIRRQGLLKRSRNHVHLSADEQTAIQVASRRGPPIILTIAAHQMHAAGYQFYLSENNVWLTESVPTQYIEFPGEKSVHA